MMDHNQNQSTKELVSELFTEVMTLFRQEVRLAQAESSEKLSKAMTGIWRLVAGVVLAFAALLVLLQALIVELAKIMDPTYATLLVGVPLAILAFILLRVGQKKVEPSGLAPTRTMASIREQTSIRDQNKPAMEKA